MAVRGYDKTVCLLFEYVLGYSRCWERDSGIKRVTRNDGMTKLKEAWDKVKKKKKKVERMGDNFLRWDVWNIIVPLKISKGIFESFKILILSNNKRHVIHRFYDDFMIMISNEELTEWCHTILTAVRLLSRLIHNILGWIIH